MPRRLGKQPSKSLGARSKGAQGDKLEDRNVPEDRKPPLHGGTHGISPREDIQFEFEEDHGE